MLGDTVTYWNSPGPQICVSSNFGIFWISRSAHLITIGLCSNSTPMLLQKLAQPRHDGPNQNFIPVMLLRSCARPVFVSVSKKHQYALHIPEKIKLLHTSQRVNLPVITNMFASKHAGLR